MDQSTSDSSVSYDDDEDLDLDIENEHETMQAILAGMQRFQFTGMDRVASSGSGTDDSWEVESYAVDSMELTKLRLPHVGVDGSDDDEEDGMLSYNSEYAMDQDDWTVQSDCNDSIGLAQTRFEHKHEQQNKVRPTLARINRRRTSLGDFIKEEQGFAPPRRNKSFSSISSSVHTVEESLSSHYSCHSDDPTGKRPSVARHKSMPSKSTPLTQAVALWPSSQDEETPRQKMARRVSNNGTPCAA